MPESAYCGWLGTARRYLAQYARPARDERRERQIPQRRGAIAAIRSTASHPESSYLLHLVVGAIYHPQDLVDGRLRIVIVCSSRAPADRLDRPPVNKT